MICQWQTLINLLPPWMRGPVDEQGSSNAQEIRLRINSPIQIITSNIIHCPGRNVTAEDITFCINTATKYSPWISDTVSKGYISAAGGHRIGICGNCVYDGGEIRNVNTITSLCIRVARDFPGVSKTLYKNHGSTLIVGRPGSGKTTLLRDLIRNISNQRKSAVGVLDERRELFPYSMGKFSFDTGACTDVLSGCSKSAGLHILLRTMCPSVIALDEITQPEDCAALYDAAWCGVDLICTAHASCKEDLYARATYRSVLENGIFQNLVTIHPDKTWQVEAL